MSVETQDFGMVRCTVDPTEPLVTMQVIEGPAPIGMPHFRSRLWGVEEIEEAVQSARSRHAAARSVFSGDQLRALTWAAAIVAAAEEGKHVARAAAALGQGL